MNSFPLGTYTVGRVGFGAMQLPGPGVFGPPRDHDEAIAVLRRAIELGIDHIDTAQFYGPRVANELIREALHPYPENLALISKVGARRDDQGNWNAAQEPDELRADIEDNLATLGTDRLAAVNLRIHSGDPSSVGPVDRDLFDRQLDAMIAARDEGLIGGIGLSSISVDHLRIALDRTDVVCVQNAYNLVDRTSQPVLDLCTERGIAFVPFFPLGSGFTTDNPVLGHPGGARRGRQARPHPGADRAGVDAERGAERAAHPGHLVGRAPRGEHGRRRHRARRADQAGPRRRGAGCVTPGRFPNPISAAALPNHRGPRRERFFVSRWTAIKSASP